MRNRKPFLSNNANENPPIEDLELSSQVIAPIIVEGDIAGAVIMLSQEGKSMGELELKLAETAAGFLAKQLGQ
jgi:AbrB family transcriptional regulator (stage V sporulation protein T)